MVGQWDQVFPKSWVIHDRLKMERISLFYMVSFTDTTEIQEGFIWIVIEAYKTKFHSVCQTIIMRPKWFFLPLC